MIVLRCKEHPEFDGHTKPDDFSCCACSAIRSARFGDWEAFAKYVTEDDSFLQQNLEAAELRWGRS